MSKEDLRYAYELTRRRRQQEEDRPFMTQAMRERALKERAAKFPKV
jgi:hypothetical protein